MKQKLTLNSIQTSGDLYIFDLDGTIADIEHRRGILDSSDPNRFIAFDDACVDDQPNIPVIKILNVLIETNAQILIFSGRSERVKLQTIEWLVKYTKLSEELLNQEGVLTMRPINDFTQDSILKNSWLNRMLDYDRDRIVAVFDDRQTVVDMWRENNITCFQVAPGDF